MRFDIQNPSFLQMECNLKNKIDWGDAFRVTSLEDNNVLEFVTLKKYQGGFSAPAEAGYSFDNENFTSVNGVSSITLNKGQTVAFKRLSGGNVVSPSNNPDPYFIASRKFTIHGNIKKAFFADENAAMPSLAFMLAFASNTHLIDASELILPDLEISTSGAYKSMFSGCTLLEKSPVLPATIVSSNAYETMFKNCSSLRQIVCLAEQLSYESATFDWMSGVPSDGVFVKSPDNNEWPTGTSGIPDGWTVQDYVEQ